MIQTMRICIMVALAVVLAGIAYSSAAQTPAPGIGIVIMHGKGGSPAKHVSTLASTLEDKGYLVANLEMPWSGRRDYDVSVNVAEQETEAALAMLRSKGARKVFVAGHSQGGLFALYFGGRHEVDGIIAMAPGGDVSNALYREKLGASVDLARKLIAEGKGNDKTQFQDLSDQREITRVCVNSNRRCSTRFPAIHSVNCTSRMRATSTRLRHRATRSRAGPQRCLPAEVRGVMRWADPPATPAPSPRWHPAETPDKTLSRSRRRAQSASAA